jgi:enterochelin esterase-like enzyme
MDTIQLNPKIDGDQVIFEWRGLKAPQLIGDFNDWDVRRAITLGQAGKDLWRFGLKLPIDAYIEYAYLIDGKRVVDPNNPRRVYNGINAYNHYFYMPGHGPTPLVKKSPGVPHGTVTRHKIAARYLLGGDDHAAGLFQRDVYLYRPPVAEPAPLLVVFDGPDYLRRAKLPLILDNLIHQKRIRPLALAMVANGKRNRFVEYACGDATPGFLLFNVLPLARKELKLVDLKKTPGAYGVLGASMGGLIALYTGLRHPDIFGKVLSQSGAFYPNFVVNDLVQAGQARQIKIWMDVGTLEYLHPFNRKMYALLGAQRYDVSYQEYHGGHNYTAWRDEVATGLESLFGI